MEWIERYHRSVMEFDSELQEIVGDPLTELNAQLRQAGVPEIEGD
jgi:hypothetical protein